LAVGFSFEVGMRNSLVRSCCASAQCLLGNVSYGCDLREDELREREVMRDSSRSTVGMDAPWTVVAGHPDVWDRYVTRVGLGQRRFGLAYRHAELVPRGPSLQDGQ